MAALGLSQHFSQMERYLAETTYFMNVCKQALPKPVLDLF